ncbi:hypothetical protein CVV72_34110 [Amycolatopsis sp. TNS106]|nr:hypothetical protein CVV72_34110 [Amycolatopsis sp. TNS106]
MTSCAFSGVLDEEFTPHDEATVLGHPVTVWEVGCESSASSVASNFGTAEVGLADIFFPLGLTTAYRSLPDAEPLPRLCAQIGVFGAEMGCSGRLARPLF